MIAISRHFLLPCAVIAAGLLIGGAGLAAGSSDRDDAGARGSLADAMPGRIGLPADFCLVERDAGPVHGRLWGAFAPPPSRGATQQLLAVDCATLREVEAGRLRRPTRLIGIYSLRPDPDLPPSAEAALAALEQRFSRPELAVKAPVIGRDRQAIYLEQGRSAAAGSGEPRGVSAFTFRSRDAFVVNVFYFGEAPPTETIRAQAEMTVRGLLAAAP